MSMENVPEAKGLLVQKSWERAWCAWDGIFEWSGMKWAGESVLKDETVGQTGAWMQSLNLPLPPWSALFRNSPNLKSFPSDHLIKQDYPDLSRVWNLPMERLWLQELNQLGSDSTDPYLAVAWQIQWRLYPAVWSWRLWRDCCTGCGSVHVRVTVYHLLIIF